MWPGQDGTPNGSGRQARELALLRRVSAALAGERDVAAIVHAALAACHELFGFDHVAVGTIEGDYLVKRGHVGLEEAIPRLPLATGVCGRVARTGIPAFVRDNGADPDYVPPGLDSTMQSTIAVPLWDRGRVDGVLVIESDARRPLHEDDFFLATALAEHVGFALERANLDAELRASIERYRTLVDQGPAILYEVDVQGERSPVRFMSAQVEALVGYPASAWHDDPALWRTLVHPEDRERRLAAVAHGDRIGHLDDLEYRVIAKDGGIRWVRERATPCAGPDGETTYWQGLIVDISADREVESERLLRAKADAARMEAERVRRQLASTLESMTDAVLTLDMDWRITFANWNAGAIMEIAAEQLIGTVLWEQCPGLVGTEFEERFRRTHVARAAQAFEAYYAPLGIWVEARSYASESGLSIYFRDVTERHEAADRIAAAEQRYRGLVEQLPAVTYLQPANGAGVTYVSPQIERLLGYPPERFLTEPRFWISLTHPEDLERVLRAERAADDTGTPFAQVYRQIAAGGRVVWVSDSTLPVRDATTGAVTSWQGFLVDVTEQKHAEDALRRREARFRALVQNASDGIAVIGEDGRVTYSSPTAEALLGLVDGGDARENLFAAFHPDDVAAARVAVGQLRADPSQSITLSARRRDANGWTHLETVLTNRFADPNVRGLVLNVRDITGRLAAERATIDAEARFRLLVEQMPGFTYLETARGDGTYRISYTSPQVLDVSGFTVDEWIQGGGALWERRIHQDDRDRVHRSYSSTRARGEPFLAVYRFFRADGGMVWLREESAQVSADAGEQATWLGVVLDVTAERDAERALRVAEARFRSIVQHASDVVSIHDAHGRRIWVSPSVERVLGYSAAELAGRTSFELVHPDDEAALRAYHTAVAAERGEVPGVELRYLHRDGSIRRLEVIAVNLLADPDVGGMVFTSRDVTERRAAETRERDAELRFKALVEQAPAGVYVLAPGDEMTFTYVSPRFESLLGHPAERWLRDGASFWEATLHPQDRARIEAVSREILRAGSGGTLEYRHRARDGRDVWVRNELTCIRGDDGLATYWLGVMVDVSDRRAADDARLRSAEAHAAREAAEAARERLYDLVQGLDAIVWEADPRTLAFTFVSQRAVDTLGYPLVDWLSGPDFLGTLVDPRDLEEAIGVRRGVVESGRSRSAEFRVSGADGRTVWVRDIVAAPDTHGLPLRGLMVDVTDRRLAEDALAHERDLLQVLMDTSPDLIYFKDIERRFTRVNVATARLLGLADPADAIGMRDEDVFLPDSAADFRADEEAILTDGVATTRVERPRPVRTDAEHWFLTNKGPIRAADGRISGLFGTAKEITDRRRLEDELRRAKDDAEAANQAKSGFVSRMSHELRTPLNAILGFAQVMLVDPLDEDQRESVEHILGAGRHLLSLINEVLDLSRIEAGGLVLRMEAVPLRDVVAECLDLIAPLAAGRRLAISADTGALDEWVEADRQRLKQILLNLLSNAVKYTGSGGEISVLWDARAEGIVRLTVNDSGPGIPPDKMPRLFEPFDRLDAEHSAVEGTGLGLAVSQRLAEAMGLSINVDSMVGSGSRFWLDLPLAAAEPAATTELAR